MKLSTRGRYSARLMLELALRYGRGPVLLKDVCESQEMSLKYLSQLIIPLKIAGLISSSRGAHGGYFLARPPEKIKLSEVIIAVEGSVDIVECVANPEICNRSDKCITRDIWAEIGKKCFETLDSYTLQHIADRQLEKEKIT
ncbi:MAG: Rrf2 family transcriptional regulator [Actinobacteria bacterium]|nr:Rrf2 family transcriptional regulator [Actinomycetota bacterium]